MRLAALTAVWQPTAGRPIGSSRCRERDLLATTGRSMVMMRWRRERFIERPVLCVSPNGAYRFPSDIRGLMPPFLGSNSGRGSGTPMPSMAQSHCRQATCPSRPQSIGLQAKQCLGTFRSSLSIRRQRLNSLPFRHIVVRGWVSAQRPSACLTIVGCMRTRLRVVSLARTREDWPSRARRQSGRLRATIPVTAQIHHYPGVARLGCRIRSRMRMLHKKAQHFPCRVWSARIGVGTGWAAPGPGVAGAVDHPLLDNRAPVRLGI
jgi:hypothetical protein